VKAKKSQPRLGVVVNIIPVTQEADRKIIVQGQPGQKLARLYLKNKMGMVTKTCGPSYSGGRGRRMEDGNQHGES
jgi:hypothetical protein